MIIHNCFIFKRKKTYHNVGLKIHLTIEKKSAFLFTISYLKGLCFAVGGDRLWQNGGLHL